jgi:hypothetical protein
MKHKFNYITSPTGQGRGWGYRAGLLQPPNLITGVGHFNYGQQRAVGDGAAHKSLHAGAQLIMKFLPSLQVNNSELSSGNIQGARARELNGT